MQWVQVLTLAAQVISPVVIACFTILLFFQHCSQLRHDKRVSRANYALALYEKRLEVYFEIEKILNVFLREARVPLDASTSFRRNCRNARFLFPEGPLEFVAELFEKSLDLECAQDEWEPLRARANRDGALSPADKEAEAHARKKMHDVQHWFRDQINLGRLAAEFDPYLKLPESL